MSSNSITNCKEIFKTCLDYIGLKNCKVESYLNHSDMCHVLIFQKEIERLDMVKSENNPKQFVDIILKPIVDAVTESDAVKDAKIELTSKIKEQEIKITELEEKIKQLAPFETYYNLALKMEHGVNK